MTAQQFTEEFRNLMGRVTSSSEIPIHCVIGELDNAHHKMQHMLIALESQQMSNGIIKAGSIPPNLKPPRPPGQ